MTETNDNRDGGAQRRDALSAAAEEALRLLDTLQQRIGREIGKGVVRGGISGLGQAFGRSAPAQDVWSEAVSAPEEDEYICRACPICRAKAAGREAGGDVTDHLVAAGGELLAAFKEMVDAVSRAPRPEPPHRPPAAPPEHAERN